MRELGISQERLAQNFFMTPAAIQKWLAGSRQPTLEQINQIADALDVTRSWLIFGFDSASALESLEDMPREIVQYLIQLEREGRLLSEHWEAIRAVLNAFALPAQKSTVDVNLK